MGFGCFIRACFLIFLNLGVLVGLNAEAKDHWSLGQAPIHSQMPQYFKETASCQITPELPIDLLNSDEYLQVGQSCFEKTENDMSGQCIISQIRLASKIFEIDHRILFTIFMIESGSKSECKDKASYVKQYGSLLEGMTGLKDSIFENDTKGNQFQVTSVAKKQVHKIIDPKSGSFFDCDTYEKFRLLFKLLEQPMPNIALPMRGDLATIGLDTRKISHSLAISIAYLEYERSRFIKLSFLKQRKKESEKSYLLRIGSLLAKNYNPTNYSTYVPKFQACFESAYEILSSSEVLASEKPIIE